MPRPAGNQNVPCCLANASLLVFVEIGCRAILNIVVQANHDLLWAADLRGPHRREFTRDGK